MEQSFWVQASLRTLTLSHAGPTMFASYGVCMFPCYLVSLESSIFPISMPDLKTSQSTPLTNSKSRPRAFKAGGSA